LKSKYIGYTAYYVTILAKKRINKVFIPSDNRKKRKRPHNEFIREVDGKTFYNIVTGEKDAIYKIYKIIPYILSDILKNNCKKNLLDPLFEKLFMKAFNV
jgi:hypothetical protein